MGYCVQCVRGVCVKDVVVCIGEYKYLNTPTLYSTPEVSPSPPPPQSSNLLAMGVGKNVKFTINCLFGNTSYVLNETLLEDIYFSLSNKLLVLLRIRVHVKVSLG